MSAAASSFRGVWRAVRRAIGEMGLGRVLLLVFGMRLALGLFAIASLALVPTPEPAGEWYDLVLPSEAPGSMWIAPWQRWDALWYQKIAQDGYSPDDGSLAFFPLYPLLVRAAGSMLGGNFALGGLVVSTFALIWALAAFRLLAVREIGRQAADNAILYLILFPTAYFFFAPFTESLFLALAVSTIIAGRCGCWWLAGMAGMLASITRAQGVTLLLPLAYEYARQSGWRARGRIPNLLAILLPAAGMGLFMLFKLSQGGGPFDELQRFWGLRTVPPWQLVADSWQHIVSRGDWAEGLNLVSLAAFSIAALLTIGRLRFTYFLVVAPQLALLLTREMTYSPAMSVSRYVLVLFPAFMLLASLGRIRRWHLPIALALLLLQCYFFFNFMHWRFVA